MSVYTTESRDVLRVKPSESADQDQDIEDRIDQIASLHDLHHESQSGLIGSVLGNGAGQPVEFELLALSSGPDHPVELYYSTDGNLETLEKRLDAIYPSSFDIEETTLDIGNNLIKPVEYTPSEFKAELKAGNLAYDLEELLVDVTPGRSAFGGELESGLDGADAEPGLVPLDDLNASTAPAPAETDTRSDPSPTEALEQQSETSLGPETDSGDFNTEVWARTGDVPSDHRFLRLDDYEDKAIKIDPASKLGDIDSRINIARPTFTDDRQVLARPSREAVAPCAVRWRGKAERKKDWMTTLRSDDTAGTEGRKEFTPKPSVLAELLTQLSEMEQPVAFQVLWRRKHSWTVEATSRKKDLKKGQDTRVQSAISTITGPSSESNTLPADVEKRINQIESKNPKRTFEVNLRAVAVDAEAAQTPDDGDLEPREAIPAQLKRLCPAFDPMDGQYYEIDGTLVKEGSKVSTETSSTPREELEYLLDHELTTSDDEESFTERWAGSSSIRAEVVMNPQELSDFITIPPGDQLPREAFRGIRAKHEEDSPLPPPNPDILSAFDDGMAVGYPLDEDRNTLETRLELPRNVLTTHYARFALTGFGKTIAANSDILTLHENTQGPEIVIDPKGDGMCERYLKAHFHRFEALDDVYYFNVPEDLPAASFFDIRPLLAQGVPREDAIQDKVDHFHEIMEMVMGNPYRNAYVAIMVLSFLIKAMFDPEYGQDAFTVDDLYQQAMRMQRDERIPRVADSRREVEQSLARHLENDESSFKETMTAVLNRLDKIRETHHLYRMFNHVPEWDYTTQSYADSTPSFSFSEFFDQNAVVLFDIGDLRPRAAKAMTLVLLSNLWDDLQERDAAEDNTLVNLILEEAAPFAATDLMANHLFSESRAFGLGMGLIMQYPGQVRDESGFKGSEKAYNEIKNNVQSTLYGRIQEADDLAGNLATYSVDPVMMKAKLSSLRKGEWLVDLPSPDYYAPVPSPFSVKALPIPGGHPESNQPLEGKAYRKFAEAHLPRAKNRVKNKYSIQGHTHGSESKYTEPATPESDTTASSADSERDPTPAPATEPQDTPTDAPATESSSTSTADDGPGEPTSVGDSTVFSMGADEPPSGIFDDGVPVDSTDEAGDKPDSDGPISFTEQNSLVDAGGDSPPEDQEDPDGEIELGPPANSDPDANTESDAESALQAPSPDTSSSTDDVDSPSMFESASSDSQPDELPAPSDSSADAALDLPADTDPAAHEEPPGELDLFPADAREPASGGDGDSHGATVPDRDSEAAGTSEPANSPSKEAPPAGGEDSLSPSGDYDTVEDVYAAAREINSSRSGVERFQALAELSSAAADAGLDVDDDQLATLSASPSSPGQAANDTDATDAELSPPEAEREPPDDQTVPSPVETESGVSWPAGSDLPPAEQPASSDSEDSPSTDESEHTATESTSTDEDTPDTERGREQTDDQTGLGEFADRVTQNLKNRENQPNFSEQPTDSDARLNLSEDDEQFLHLVLNAMNDELADYSITTLDSMNPLVTRAGDPDIDRLIDLNLVEKHRVIRKQFYTVLPKGRKYLKRSLTSRDGIGDLGEKTPHKVGVAILWHYLANRNDTSRVKRYQTIDGNKYDAVAYDSSGTVVAVGEAETPSNNTDSIVTDYEKMAELDADAIWLCKNHDTALEVINALEQRDIFDTPFTSTEKKSFSTLMDAASEKALPGMTEIQAFTSTYDDLNQ